MEIKLYIDVLFLTNFMFDFLLLWLTGRLLCSEPRLLSLLFASALGGIFALVSFFVPSSLPLSLLLKLLVACMMVAIAYRPRSLRIFGRFSAIFLVCSLTVGGALFCLVCTDGIGARLGAVFQNTALYINLPVYTILAVFVSCFFLLRAYIFVSDRLCATKHNIVLLHVTLGKGSVRLRGFCDSGNLLRGHDGRGVMIAEERAVGPLLMQEGLHLTTLRYHTLQGEGRLQVFLPDAIEVEQGNRRVPIAPLYVGITRQPLTLYHHWDAVLPYHFEEVKNHEIQNCDHTAKAL